MLYCIHGAAPIVERRKKCMARKTRNKVGRMVYHTVVRGTMVNPDNTMEPFEVKVAGTLGFDRAQSAAQKRLGTTRILVDSIEHVRAYASMSLDAFLKNCDSIVELPAETEN